MMVSFSQWKFGVKGRGCHIRKSFAYTGGAVVRALVQKRNDCIDHIVEIDFFLF